VEVGVGRVTVFRVYPMQAQADEYLTVPEQIAAYPGIVGSARFFRTVCVVGMTMNEGITIIVVSSVNVLVLVWVC